MCTNLYYYAPEGSVNGRSMNRLRTNALQNVQQHGDSIKEAKKFHMPGKRKSSAMSIEIYFCTSCNFCFNLFPVGSHLVEHF
jgi:formate hydrogenlyase subunit 6/NADH:ubiquinone oxidoreductase subunit I